MRDVYTLYIFFSVDLNAAECRSNVHFILHSCGVQENVEYSYTRYECFICLVPRRVICKRSRAPATAAVGMSSTGSREYYTRICTIHIVHGRIILESLFNRTDGYDNNTYIVYLWPRILNTFKNGFVQ